MAGGISDILRPRLCRPNVAAGLESVVVTRGGFADAFGYALAEFGRGDDFDVAAIAENEALEFVVDDDFE